MFKRQVTGTDQDRDTHMLLVAGSQLHAENPGQKVTGREITSREIAGRVITATVIELNIQNSYDISNKFKPL
jgi:hypothetical protein